MNRRHYIAAGAMAAALASGMAAAAPLACPTLAPATWGIGKARLDSVRVLAYLAGDTLSEDALPSGPPDREWRRGNALYQSWAMNAGAPQAVYQVDCLYSGTKRFLRLDAGAVKQCLARWELNRRQLIKGSLIFRCD